MNERGILDLLEQQNKQAARLIVEHKKKGTKVDTRPAALEAAEAARYLGVGRTKFFKDIRPQMPPAIPLGGKMVYRRAWLDKVLDHAERGRV